MSVDWNEVNKALSPIKDYHDLVSRLHESFGFVFVRVTFNFSMPELAQYTQLALGGDSRHRYTEYTARLVGILNQMHQAGVLDLIDLIERIDTQDKLEVFVAKSGIVVQDIIAVAKYLVFWFIPGKKYLSGLVRSNDLETGAAIRVLAGLGIRTNLELLEKGITPAGRKTLAEASGLPEPVIIDLVNRADFSRMPWTSKATLSNIISAGYGSLTKLANAEPEQLYADFINYGKAIGKNLKLGNEIDNSYRLAQVVPRLVLED